MGNGQHSKQARRDDLARKVVDLGVSSLFVDMPFLDTALFRLTFKPAESGKLRSWATDGRDVLFDSRHVLLCYKRHQACVPHDVLHVTLHCVFRHMFVEPHVNQRFWNLACDIAVELLIDSLQAPSVDDGRFAQRAAFLGALVDVPETRTAERIYRVLSDADLSEEDLLVLEDSFFVDDHPWYFPGANQQPEGNDASEGKSDGQYDPGEGGGRMQDESAELLEKEWKEASQSVQTGLETMFNRLGRSERGQGLLQALRDVNRKRYDYKRFLESLCSWGEQMRINDDEYDYVYYNLGLELYGDMPLIEPLEYKELKKLRDVAIVVDTSGSVAGDVLQHLLERTYDLISGHDNAHRRFRIHLLQCDDQVQDDVVLNTVDDFEREIGQMSFKGLGGTDFTAAFSYVDELVARGEFVNFKGVIYFTDGQGTYPTHAPRYKAAFVFLEESCHEADVPAWAVKLVLSDDEVRKL